MCLKVVDTRRAGKAKEALITVDALRTLAPPTRDDPRIDLAEALAANYSNDFMRGQAAGARAAAKGAANGAALLVVDARLQEGFALFRLGEIEKARATLEEVKRIAAVLGDLRTTARVLNASGDLLRNQGDLPGAEKMYQQSLALFRRIGNRLGVASVLLNIGGLLVEGDLVGAEKMYKAALPIHREIDNRVGVADTLTSIGGLLLRQGKLVGAEKMYEAALPIYRDAGYKNGIAWALQWMAVSAWEQGDTAAAKKMLTESLSISEELGDKGATAVSRANLAELSIDEGDATNAGPLAQKAIDEARAAKNNRNQAYPHAVLALAFLAHGKLSDAQEEINRATALVEQKNRWGRLHVGIIAARVRAATCEPADTGQALKNLEGILAEATKTGYVLHQLEARFALGEIEGKSGRTVTARAHLEALEKHARAMGFGLIARKAAEARKQNLRC